MDSAYLNLIVDKMQSFALTLWSEDPSKQVTVERLWRAFVRRECHNRLKWSPGHLLDNDKNAFQRLFQFVELILRDIATLVLSELELEARVNVGNFEQYSPSVLSMESKVVHIVILGASLSGLILAHRLQYFGFHVTLVDREPICGSNLSIPIQPSKNSSVIVSPNVSNCHFIDMLRRQNGLGKTSSTTSSTTTTTSQKQKLNSTYAALNIPWKVNIVHSESGDVLPEEAIRDCMYEFHHRQCNLNATATATLDEKTIRNQLKMSFERVKRRQIEQVQVLQQEEQRLTQNCEKYLKKAEEVQKKASIKQRKLAGKKTGTFTSRESTLQDIILANAAAKDYSASFQLLRQTDEDRMALEVVHEASVNLSRLLHNRTVAFDWLMNVSIWGYESSKGNAQLMIPTLRLSLGSETTRLCESLTKNVEIKLCHNVTEVNTSQLTHSIVKCIAINKEKEEKETNIECDVVVCAEHPAGLLRRVSFLPQLPKELETCLNGVKYSRKMSVIVSFVKDEFGLLGFPMGKYEMLAKGVTIICEPASKSFFAQWIPGCELHLFLYLLANCEDEEKEEEEGGQNVDNQNNFNNDKKNSTNKSFDLDDLLNTLQLSLRLDFLPKVSSHHVLSPDQDPFAFGCCTLTSPPSPPVNQFNTFNQRLYFTGEFVQAAKQQIDGGQFPLNLQGEINSGLATAKQLLHQFHPIDQFHQTLRKRLAEIYFDEAIKQLLTISSDQSSSLDEVDEDDEEEEEEEDEDEEDNETDNETKNNIVATATVTAAAVLNGNHHPMNGTSTTSTNVAMDSQEDSS